MTFLESPSIELQARGIALEQAADLRARLAAFAEEWESPEMEIYDDYDAASPRLPTPIIGLSIERAQ